MPFVAVPHDAKDFLRDLSTHFQLAQAEASTLLETGPSGLAYWNCYEYARKYGGKIMFGWQVLAWPDIYIELLHHAVVEDVDGNLLDPTTCTASHNGQAVFIEDKTAILSRTNPPPIPSKFLIYPGETNGLGQSIMTAKARHFDIKRHLARIVEDSGIYSTPILADYPWPKSPEIAGMLEELNKSNAVIETLHAACRMWDARKPSRWRSSVHTPSREGFGSIPYKSSAETVALSRSGATS